MDIKSAQAILDSAQRAMGDSLFDSLTAKMRKRRVPSNRDKREFMPWKDLWKLAKRQRLICGICKDPAKPMAKDRRYTVLDHIDQQRIDFNHPDNLQAAHDPCNAAKSAKNQTDTSKMVQTGRHRKTQFTGEENDI